MERRAALATRRGRLFPGISAAFLYAAQDLAIRRAARDAHRTECNLDADECNICRMHATRIAEAKTALRRDHLA